MIRSQSSREPLPLDYPFHICLSVFPLFIGWRGWLKWAEVGYFSSAGYLGSDKTPGDWAILKQLIVRASLIKKNGVLSHISKWFLPCPPPSGGMRGFFFNIYCENLVELPQVPLKLLTLRLVHTQPQQFISYSLNCVFCFSGTPLVASAGESLLWKTVTPYTCLSVFPIWRQQFAGYPPLSHRSRKSFGFFNLLSFNLLLGHSGDFQALYKRNEKPEVHIFQFKVYLSPLVFNCNIVF